MKQRNSERGSILPATILLLAATLMGFQAVLTVTAQHHMRMDDFIRQEQCQYLAASGWNMAIEQLQEVQEVTAEKLSLTVADIGTISSRWFCFADEIIIVATGKAGENQCTYQGRVKREPIYSENDLPEEDEEDVPMPEPIGYRLILLERNID